VETKFLSVARADGQSLGVPVFGSCIEGWAKSSPSDANGRTSAVVAHNENPHDITNDTKQEMIREAVQVYAADIALANREGFRPLGRLLHVMSQLGVKFIGELWRRNPLVIPHDLGDIRRDLRM
jgi:hypothetical protein